MNIEVFAICYNEEIMLPYFLRHYSQMASKITIYDNYSTDRSEEICRSFEKVKVIKFDSGNQIRDDIYLQIKNNCWKGSKADWVIVCDIDEIVVELNAPTPIDDYTVIMPDWYEMVSDRLPSTEDQIYREINEGVCQGQISKCLVFCPDKIKEINYHPGAHGIDAAGDVRVLHTSQMGILHYKYLSPEYVIERHRLFQSRLSKINIEMKWGVHYNNSAEEIRGRWKELWEKRVRII